MPLPQFEVVLIVENEAFATAAVPTSKDPLPDVLPALEPLFYTTAEFYWDYYFDIADDLASVQIGVELWAMEGVNDKKLLVGDHTYSVGTTLDPNPTPEITVTQFDNDGEVFSWVILTMETIGLKRVNSLAVYSEDNFYEGHYPSLERFTMLVLGVKEAGGPFVAGVNIILVPVSIFTRTELNTKLQGGDHPAELGEASDSEQEAQFFGIDATAETVSQHIEGLIIKGLEEGDWVTISEALAILDYVLKNEEGEFNFSYFACDEVGEVERLGLPVDVLEQVPGDAQALQMGPTGDTPSKLTVGRIFLIILTFGILAAITPILLAAALTAALIYVGIVLLGPIFSAAILLLIKLIVLIFILILFALTMLGLLLGFLISVPFLISISKSRDMELSIGPLSYNLKNSNLFAQFEIIVVFKYSSFLDLTFPCIVIAAYDNSQQYYNFLYSYGMPIDAEESSITNLENIDRDEIAPQTHSETTSIDLSAFSTGRLQAYLLALTYMGIVAFCPIGWVSIILAISSSIIIFITYLIYRTLWSSSPDKINAFEIGFGLGLFQAGIITLIPHIVPYGAKGDAVMTFFAAVSFNQLKFSFFPEIPIDPVIDTLYTIALPIASVGLYNFVLGGDFTKKLAWQILASILMIMGMEFVVFNR